MQSTNSEQEILETVTEKKSSDKSFQLTMKDWNEAVRREYCESGFIAKKNKKRNECSIHRESRNVYRARSWVVFQNA